MTRLEHIEIEGFKGIESLEFEPSGINLITGRNNTGKTSVLEAVSMLFDPNEIRRFGENVDTVINVHSDESRLGAITTDGDSTITLREPTIDEIGRYLPDAILDMVNHIAHIFNPIPSDLQGRISEEYEPIIEGVLSEEVDERDLDRFKEEILVVEIDDRQLPFFFPGRASYEILSEVSTRIKEKNDEDEPGENQSVPKREIWEERERRRRLWDEISEHRVEYAISRRFFLSPPDKFGEVRFIESTDLTGDIEPEDEDKAAIKIDDIGDYIKEHRLVDDLKTFDLDYLVFENDDGEKYQIPYDFMGDGFKSIVGLLWELLDDDIGDQVVLIEELENHMHPGYIREVVYFLIHLARDENVQLFITTHDSDFINDFFNENLTDEEREYLEEEFTLIRMEEHGAMVVDYETAESDLKDLHLDLRGI